jgi:hypothetical protein
MSLTISSDDGNKYLWDEIPTQRRLNKLRGLPTTSEVGIIAELLHQLRVFMHNSVRAVQRRPYHQCQSPSSFLGRSSRRNGICVKRSRAEMTSMIFTPRHNDWNQALWISAHYVCILLLIRYHCFNDFASATPLKSVISALCMWVAIVSWMCRRYPTFIC